MPEKVHVHLFLAEPAVQYRTPKGLSEIGNLFLATQLID